MRRFYPGRGETESIPDLTRLPPARPSSLAFPFSPFKLDESHVIQIESATISTSRWCNQLNLFMSDPWPENCCSC